MPPRSGPDGPQPIHPAARPADAGRRGTPGLTPSLPAAAMLVREFARFADRPRPATVRSVGGSGPGVAAGPALRVPTATGGGPAAPTHLVPLVGVRAGRGLGVGPVRSREPDQLGPAESEPAQRLVRALVPGVHHSGRSAHPIGVLPGGRRCHRSSHGAPSLLPARAVPCTHPLPCGCPARTGTAGQDGPAPCSRSGP